MTMNIWILTEFTIVKLLRFRDLLPLLFRDLPRRTFPFDSSYPSDFHNYHLYQLSNRMIHLREFLEQLVYTYGVSRCSCLFSFFIWGYWTTYQNPSNNRTPSTPNGVFFVGCSSINLHDHSWYSWWFSLGSSGNSQEYLQSWSESFEFLWNSLRIRGEGSSWFHHWDRLDH